MDTISSNNDTAKDDSRLGEKALLIGLVAVVVVSVSVVRMC